MESNLDTFRIVNANDIYSLNQAHKQGYELVSIFYDEIVQNEYVQDKVPVTYTISTGTNINNYGYSGPTHNIIDKEVPLIRRTARALMRLNSSAQVIYGKE